jgi:hypothetical protein
MPADRHAISQAAMHTSVRRYLLSSYPEPILLKIQTPRVRDNPIDSKFPVDILLSHRRVMTIKI